MLNYRAIGGRSLKTSTTQATRAAADKRHVHEGKIRREPSLGEFVLLHGSYSESGPYKEPPFESHKSAEVELKIIRAEAAVVARRPGLPSSLITPVDIGMRRRAASNATQSPSANVPRRTLFRAEIVILPSPRRIAAPLDPPSFLPAPPACQSPVTSSHGWLPSLVRFSVLDRCSVTVSVVTVAAVVTSVTGTAT